MPTTISLAPDGQTMASTVTSLVTAANQLITDLNTATAFTPGTGGTAGTAIGEEPRLSELAGCEVERTGDRRFRVLMGPGRGCEAATQFVGEIPPGRAPEHSHPYDEVVLVLDGEGVAHAGGREDQRADPH